jgi:hypothetical protein
MGYGCLEEVGAMDNSSIPPGLFPKVVFLRQHAATGPGPQPNKRSFAEFAEFEDGLDAGDLPRKRAAPAPQPPPPNTLPPGWPASVFQAPGAAQARRPEGGMNVKYVIPGRECRQYTLGPGGTKGEDRPASPPHQGDYVEPLNFRFFRQLSKEQIGVIVAGQAIMARNTGVTPSREVPVYDLTGSPTPEPVAPAEFQPVAPLSEAQGDAVVTAQVTGLPQSQGALPAGEPSLPSLDPYVDERVEQVLAASRQMYKKLHDDYNGVQPLRIGQSPPDAG